MSRADDTAAFYALLALVLWPMSDLSRTALLWYALSVSSATYPGLGAPSFWTCAVALLVVRILLARHAPAGRKLDEKENALAVVGYFLISIVSCGLGALGVWLVS